MRKLLIIIPALERGGAETYAQVIATACTPIFEVHAAVTSFPALQQLCDDLGRHNVRCHKLSIPQQHFIAVQEEHRWKHSFENRANGRFHALHEVHRIIQRGAELRRLVSQWARLFRLLISLRPDVILLNIPWGTFGLGIILACASLNVPTAVIFHLYPFGFVFRRLKVRAYRWAWRRNQRWIAVSDHSRTLISQTFGIPRDTILRIYNGIPLHSLPECHDRDEPRREICMELGLPDRAVILLTVGRLEVTKGYGLMLQALTRLLPDFPNVYCVWAGEGKDRIQLERQAAEYAVDRHVVFAGYRSDTARLMRAADLFVLPTLFEGLPFVLLEAMAQGVPVIASDVGGIPELIDDGVHGLLTRPGDVGSLLQALRWALTHPDDMKAMATAARCRIEQFSQERMVQETLAVLQTLSEL